MKGILTMLYSLFLLLSVTGQQQNLIALIKTVESKHNVVFSYNESLLKDIAIEGEYSNIPLDKTLYLLTAKSAFTFERIDTENILVKAKQEGKNMRLCLNVIDKKTKETLIGTNIYNPSKKTGFMIGNDYEVKYINLQEWDTVMIRFVGYNVQSYPISYFNGKDSVTISLQEGEIKLSELTVKAYLNKGVKYNHTDQSIRVSINDAGLLPGETETDILTVVEALPGIKSPDGKAGNLVLRGDDPDKTLLTFDNIPIYHNGHYFGAFSPFNANILEEVKVFRSGYDIENGGRVGGAIELFSRQGVPDSSSYGVGASTSYFSAYADIPIKPKKVSVLVAGRSSYPFDWNSPKIAAISDFVFQNSAIAAAEDLNFVEMTDFKLYFSDLNLKGTYQANENNEFSLSLLNIYNDFNLGILDTKTATKTRHDATLKNSGMNLLHKHTWNNKLSTENSITVSDFAQEFKGQVEDTNAIRETSNYINTVKDINFKSSSVLQLKKLNFLKFGYSLTHHEVYSFREIARTIEPLYDLDKNKAYLHSLFSSYNFSGNHLQATLGIRGTYYTLLKKFYAVPRLLINYHFNQSITAKVNIGMYNQFVNHLYGTHAIGPGIENYNWRLSNGTNTPVVNAKQAMLGILIDKRGWIIDIEAYSKRTENISIHNQYDYLNIENHFQGDYSTTGIDIMIKKSIHNLDAWVGYTYANTMVQFDSIQETAFESIWNQNHVFNAVLGYQLNQLKISVGWKYRTGLATLDGIRYLYTNGPSTTPTKPPPPGAPAPPTTTIEYTDNSDPDYGSLFPSSNQLDVSISYTLVPKSKKWYCNLGASVINLYDTKAIIGQAVKPAVNAPPNVFTRTNLYGIGFAPSVMVMFHF